LISEIAAMKSAGMDPTKIPSTGQDAELPSVKSILAGEQTSTVFKDTRNLAAQAAKMADQMLKGSTVDTNDTKTYDNGVKVVMQSAAADTTKDYGPVAQAVKQSGAPAMFYAGYDAQGAQLAKALAAVKYKGLRMSGNGVKSSVFSDGAKKSGEGWYFSCGCSDALTAESAKQFVADYKAMFNTDPSTYSPEAYDATNILIEAIKRAADAGTVTREAVNAEVNKTDYQGITGPIKFAENGDLPPGTGVVNLFQQKNGTIVSLGDITKAK